MHEPTEERTRIDVTIAIAETEVESAGGASDRLAADHQVIDIECLTLEVAVRDATTVGVANDDVHRSGNRTGERDPTGRNGHDASALDRSELDTSIALAPLTGRRSEPIGDRRRDRRVPARQRMDDTGWSETCDDGEHDAHTMDERWHDDTFRFDGTEVASATTEPEGETEFCSADAGGRHARSQVNDRLGVDL